MGYLGGFLGTDLATRLPTNLAARPLPLNLLYYANASPRYITVEGRMTSFAAFELATRIIGGREYIQLESSKSTINTHSEVFRDAISNWAQVRVNVSDDQAVSPVGDMTADFVYDDSTPTNTHYLQQTFTTDGSSSYVFSVFLKAGARYKGRITLFGGFAANAYGDFDLSTGTIIGGNYDAIGIIPLDNGYYFLYISNTSNSIVASGLRIQLADNDGTLSYSGDGASGLYVWGANGTRSDILTSYIQAVATTQTRSKDEAYYDAADIPVWLRDGYRQYIYFDKEDSVMCAAAGTKRVLTSWDAAETVTVYLDGADNKIHVLGSVTGQFVESAALSWSLNQNTSYSIQFDNGTNCVLTTRDFTTGNGAVTGTQIAAATGNIGFGMNHTANTEQAENLISALEHL